MKCLPLLICAFSLHQIVARSQRGVLSGTRAKNDSYSTLARAIQLGVNDDTSNYSADAIALALRSLSKAQATLKKIDGTAHEMYQRTHKSRTNLATEEDEDEDYSESNKIGSLKVAGRMSRKAARLGCIADALFTAELCEMFHLTTESKDTDEKLDNNDPLIDEEGTLTSWTGRKVVLRTAISATKASKLSKCPTISVMVIYEPGYSGGAGTGHGGVDNLLRFSKDDLIDSEDKVSNSIESGDKPRGRYLVILSDESSPNIASIDDLTSVVSILDSEPCEVNVRRGSASSESASLCDPLYQLAGKVVDAIRPVISGSSNDTKNEEDSDSETNSIQHKASLTTQQKEAAVHIVGHSLAGGIAALTALILEGSVPHPKSMKNKSKVTGDMRLTHIDQGIARERSSAFCLGPPPCLSPNIRAPFITSIIHGDDFICRASRTSLKHLYERTRHSIKGGALGRSMGWMTDAVSLTVSGLKSQSKKKNDKLIVPGKVFLIRPRRIGGGSSSIHEVGDNAAGVRESLRAAVLWQLNDVLLSGSMLTHHGLHSYIRSLDRVKLSGLADESIEE